MYFKIEDMNNYDGFLFRISGTAKSMWVMFTNKLDDTFVECNRLPIVEWKQDNSTQSATKDLYVNAVDPVGNNCDYSKDVYVVIAARYPDISGTIQAIRK